MRTKTPPPTPIGPPSSGEIKASSREGRQRARETTKYIRAITKRADQAAKDPQRRVGRYVALRELGRGAMGIVFHGWDPQLSREVAIKILQPCGSGAFDIERERLVREARSCGRLRHRGIVGVHDVGEHKQQPYVVMEFIEGSRTLEDVIEDRPEIDDALELIIEVSRAIAHAHERNVVHRDLKPANVLIDSSGQAIVTDFGLAQTIEKPSQLTQDGTVLGTPEYMAPEQVEGYPDVVGPPTDVYALGAVLYQAFCGRTPFQASSLFETLERIVETEAVPPRSLRPEISTELEGIILRCLSKDPSHRPTAGRLADLLKDELARRRAQASADAAGAGLALPWVLAIAGGALVAGLVLGRVVL